MTMEHRVKEELLGLLRDAVRVGGAPIEMRMRRLVSATRPSDPELANSLMSLLPNAMATRSISTPSSPIDSDSRLSLLRTQSSAQPPQAPIFAPHVHADLERLLEERRASDRLMSAGLTPIRSLMLSGPPGVGKTMTAQWLAERLQVPLLTLDLASVVNSYLGKTGSNVRAALDHAQQFPCVLLLDEFDAIAKRRDDDRDVGELKRLVTVLLQAVDDWSPTSLLVAATNHGELLDPAIWRRFDMAIEVPLPGMEERRRFLESRGLTEVTAEVVAECTDGASIDALERAVQIAHKDQILRGIDVQSSILRWTDKFLTQSGEQEAHLKIEILRRKAMGESFREIGESVGMSHTSAQRRIKPKRLGEKNAKSKSVDRVG